jgi:hypothetical protein
MYRSMFAFVVAMAALAAILVPSTLTAQITFEHTSGGVGGYGYSVRQTLDGDIVAGTTCSGSTATSTYSGPTLRATHCGQGLSATAPTTSDCRSQAVVHLPNHGCRFPSAG